MNKALSHKLPALLIAFCLLLICLLTALPTDVLADTTIEEDQQALNDLEAQRKAYMQQLEALQAQINASKNEEKTLLAEKSELEQEITLLDSSIETNETLMEQYRFQIESNEIALDALELRLLAHDGGFLLAQQLLDAPDVAVAQKGTDLPERHIQRAQVADGVEHLKLPRPVVAVAGRGVGVFRREQADGLIVAQAAHAQVKQLRHVADGKEFLRARHVSPPPARAGRAAAAPETQSRR